MMFDRTGDYYHPERGCGQRNSLRSYEGGTKRSDVDLKDTKREIDPAQPAH